MAIAQTGTTSYDERSGPKLTIPKPPAEDEQGRPVFEIGLVLAGAVSAGAYTGGVIDFLVEALDAYEDALASGKAEGFAHRVRLKVVSGASAGGMTAAMLATAVSRKFNHIRTVEDAAEHGDGNPFYRPWVREIDMRDLLGNRDLQASPVVRSLLDCTPLDDILKRSLAFRQTGGEDLPPASVKVATAAEGGAAQGGAAEGKAAGEATAKPAPRSWLADGFMMVFAITNLRGVGYSFGFRGGDGATYAMTRHNDCARFWVNATPRDPAEGPLPMARPDATPLYFGKADDPDGWEQMGQAALATAAFPVALRARTVRPNPGVYDAEWFVDHDHASLELGGDYPTDFKMSGSVIHLTEAGSGQSDRRYAAADGGVINNEPLELARVELAGILGSNPRDAMNACRAVIMVDPFPDPPTQDTYLDAEHESLLSLAGGVVSAMKNQGRFHPEDIRLALDPGVCSRFMISPIGRQRRTGGRAIASGALGGFSGFLDETYRRHDFLLGRANCQRFLREQFLLEIDPEDGKGRRQRSMLFRSGNAKTAQDNAGQRPILPLFGTAAEQCPIPDWPVDSFKPSQLRGPILRRIEAVGRAYVEQAGWQWRWLFATAWGASIGGGLVRGQLAGSIVEAIRRRLVAHELLSADRKGD